MAYRNWKCKKCEHKEPFFDHEDKVCPKCGNTDLKKLYSPPLKAKATDKVDRYHNVDMERGIDEDIRLRSRRHTLDTIDEFIDEHGEEAAKLAGLLVTDDNGKTWRKKTPWDENLQGKTNSGSGE